MSDNFNEKLIATLAAVETRAKIAEAKANLALEMIMRKATASDEEKENDPNYPFNNTFEKMNSERDFAASIAFKTLSHFQGGNSNFTEEMVHDDNTKIEEQKVELENAICEDLIRRLSVS